MEKNIYMYIHITTTALEWICNIMNLIFELWKTKIPTNKPKQKWGTHHHVFLWIPSSLTWLSSLHFSEYSYGCFINNTQAQFALVKRNEGKYYLLHLLGSCCWIFFFRALLRSIIFIIGPFSGFRQSRQLQINSSISKFSTYLDYLNYYSLYWIFKNKIFIIRFWSSI